MNPQYILKTLGCKANLVDSQLIEQGLQNQGWAPERGSSEEKIPGGDNSNIRLCIVNSCTVTNEADRQSRKMAAKLARDYPQATIVMTGCGAEVDPSAYLNSKGVDLVVGNQNKNQFVDLVSSHILKPQKPQILGTVENYTHIISRHPMDREWPSALDSFSTPPTQLSGNSDKTRSFLKIQEGCNSFCTYCIIPYGRGPSRSLRPREIIKQVQQLVEQGVREVILTGTNIGDYGIEWKGVGEREGRESSEEESSANLWKSKNLADLLKLILKETSLERLRISSLDPSEITPQITELMERNPRICPHFHVSLQSPHARILRLMKRNYGSDEVQECLKRISQIAAPLGGVYAGMDVITGFPGETDEEFEWGYQILKELPWSRLHVFPYSERNGTPATRLPHSVPQHIRVQRTRTLTQLSMERLKSNYSEVLKKCQTEGLFLDSVLTEKQGSDSWISGFTPNYLKILLPSDLKLERNQLVKVMPVDLMIDSKANDVALISKLIV